jgi:hypothetical protein
VKEGHRKVYIMDISLAQQSINNFSQSPITSPSSSSAIAIGSTNTSASLVFALEATKRERDIKADDAQRLSSLATTQARELEMLRERVIASDALARMLKSKSEALESENSILREATTTFPPTLSIFPTSSPYSGFSLNSPTINNQSNSLGLGIKTESFDGRRGGGFNSQSQIQSSPHNLDTGLAPNAFQLYNEVSAMHIEISSLRNALDQSRNEARIAERASIDRMHERERSQDSAPLALIRDLRNALTNQSEQLEEARLAIKSMRDETQEATRAAQLATDEARKASEIHAAEISSLKANHARELERRLSAANEARIHESVSDAQTLQRLSMLEREVPALRRSLQMAEDRCFVLQRRLAVSEDELAIYKRCDVYSSTLRKSISESKLHFRNENGGGAH